MASNAVVFPTSDLTSAFGMLVKYITSFLFCKFSKPGYLFLHNTAAGLGWGLVSSLMLYGSTLGDAIGPGTEYTSNCSEMSSFCLAGIDNGCDLVFFIYALINVVIIT